MTKTPWTPGPWRAQGEYVRSDASDEALRSVGKRGRTVADCRLANGRADARLIAAAPELYEALKECLALLESADHDQFDGVWSESDFEETYAPFRAALAKARGGA